MPKETGMDEKCIRTYTNNVYASRLDRLSIGHTGYVYRTQTIHLIKISCSYISTYPIPFFERECYIKSDIYIPKESRRTKSPLYSVHFPSIKRGGEEVARHTEMPSLPSVSPLSKGSGIAIRKACKVYSPSTREELEGAATGITQPRLSLFIHFSSIYRIFYISLPY